MNKKKAVTEIRIRKVHRPLVLFAADQDITDKLEKDQQLYVELRKNNILDYGFRYCHRYCLEDIHTKSLRYNYRIIHVDPASPCMYWKRFIESIRDSRRTMIITVPTSELTTKHFIEALDALRRRFPRLRKQRPESSFQKREVHL